MINLSIDEEEPIMVICYEGISVEFLGETMTFQEGVVYESWKENVSITNIDSTWVNYSDGGHGSRFSNVDCELFTYPLYSNHFYNIQEHRESEINKILE